MTADTLTAPPAPEAVAAALAALGDGPDAVARSLDDAGARGRRGKPLDCPVGAYLRGLLGARTVLVAGGVATWVGGSAALPAPVADFTRAFHAGAYPDLAVTAEGH